MAPIANERTPLYSGSQQENRWHSSTAFNREHTGDRDSEASCDERESTPSCGRKAALARGLLICLAVVCSVVGSLIMMSGFDSCPRNPHVPDERGDVPGTTRRIAVIAVPLMLTKLGAGASGVSAAYHLAKSRRPRDTVEITVFERSDRVGGRCETVHVPFGGAGGPNTPGKMAVELGAPGFHTSMDPLFTSIVHELGMADEQLVPGGRWGPVEGDWELGIYDGESLLFRKPYNPSILGWLWTSISPFFRYGWSGWIMGTVTSKLTPLWKHYTNAVALPGAATLFPKSLIPALTTQATVFLENAGVRSPFSTEQVQARVRARYAANLGVVSGMHAVRALRECDTAREEHIYIRDEDGRGIAGVLSKMLQAAGNESGVDVEVKLSSPVLGVRRNTTGDEKGDSNVGARWMVSYSAPGLHEHVTGAFEHVVIASAWAQARMQVPLSVSEPPQTSFEAVHVTVFTTPGQLAPEEFGLSKGDLNGMSQMLLSTLHEGAEQEKLAGRTGTVGVGGVGWWSVEHVGTVLRAVGIGRGGEYHRVERVYKILSPKEIPDRVIARMVGGEVGWVYRHHWEHAFATPLFTEPDMRIKLDDGLWYTAGMEGVWDGLEGAVVMGKRVAEEIASGWGWVRPGGAKKLCSTSMMN
ncbi:hypothetical protein BDZ91DRAFT_828907 [Kalaharituber pfeilii]|nr:hypothetical protein BDZ91DRAFT_828907 [Kalaharituber pfeilii]